MAPAELPAKELELLPTLFEEDDVDLPLKRVVVAQPVFNEAFLASASDDDNDEDFHPPLNPSLFDPALIEKHDKIVKDTIEEIDEVMAMFKGVGDLNITTSGDAEDVMPEAGPRRSRRANAGINKNKPEELTANTPSIKKEVKPRLVRSKGRTNFYPDGNSVEKELFGPHSKLAEVDLHAYFRNPLAWDVLDEEEKEELRSLLPEALSYDSPNGGPTKAFLSHDMDWRNGVREFQEGIARGYYDPEWRRQAGKAMEERAAGKFDEFKNKNFEQFYGQKKKLDYDALAGRSARIKLKELIDDGTFQVGDIWSYARVFGKGKGVFLIEKEVTLFQIHEDGELTFQLPPGQEKYLRLSIGSIANSSQLPAVAKSGDGKRKSLHDEAARTRESSSVDSSKQRTRKRVTFATEEPRLTSSETTDQLVMQTGADDIPDGLRMPVMGREVSPKKPILMAAIQSPYSPRTVRRMGKPLPPIPFGDPSWDERMEALSKEIDSPASFLSELPDNETPPWPHGIGKHPQQKYELNPKELSKKLEEVIRKSASPPPVQNPPISCKIKSMQFLEHKIIEVDGRVGNYANKGNGWKNFHAKRGGKDLGTLADIRAEYFRRKYPKPVDSD